MKRLFSLSFILIFSLGCQPYTTISRANDTDSKPAQRGSFQEVYRMETFQVENPILDVRTSGGGVFIEGGDRSSVEVMMIVRRNGRIVSPEDVDLSDYLITIEQRGNTIVAHAERESGWNWGFGDKKNYSITFRINMPRKGEIDASTSGGSMRATGVEGPIHMRTSGGSITLNETIGHAELRTSGGSLEIENHTGSLDGRTSGGSITINESLGDVDVRTSGGSIRVEEFSGSLFGRTSGGSIRADIIEVTGDVNLSTSGGSVRISIPGRLGYDLDLSGNSVNVELMNFTGESKRDRVKGSMNGGGILLRGSTSGGSVRVDFYHTDKSPI